MAMGLMDECAAPLVSSKLNKQQGKGCPFHAVILVANPVRRFGDFTRWKEHDAYRRRSTGCCATCGSRRASGTPPWYTSA